MHATATGQTGERPAATPERKERKEQALTQSTASVVPSISEAVVAKDGEPFFLCPPDGQIPCSDGHGYGLYHHDCRFLGGFELSLAGSKPNPLAATAADGREIILELTNPDIRMADDRLIGKEQLGITWTRRVDGDAPSLEDTLEFRNYGSEAVRLPLDMRFRARFEDVFEIRGLVAKEHGQLAPPSWDDDHLEFTYAGADGIDRGVRLTFDPAPEHAAEDEARFNLEIAARGRSTIRVTAMIEEHTQPGAEPIEQREAAPEASKDSPPQPSTLSADPRIDHDAWSTNVETTSLIVQGIVDRSLADLRMLRARLDGQRFYEAGIPWFATLFGRDSLITALQTLAFEPAIAADTLRLLADRQGRVVDEWRDEAPGKILHELRIGELARIGAIPHSPYYGTVDATPLFLVLLGRHAGWTGSLDLFHALSEAVDGALGWLDREIEASDAGFVEYRSATSKTGLANQGWKDSGDAIVTADGKIATPPIALAEVQGYTYQAWLEMAGLFERDGQESRATELRQKAADLRERFERDFWSDDLDCYVLALGNGQACEVVASNAGQVLWSGIGSKDRAERTTERLMRSDMFNGWGIRTLSGDADAYHPIGYHLGTVWPHDNAIITEGFRRYGQDDAAELLFVAMLEAAQDFPHGRLPECFAGYDRADFGVPVRYPVACHPQAWAAGTIPSMLVAILGLSPEGFDRRLTIHRPRLPDFIGQLELRGLRVGDARVHLRFELGPDGTTVEVVAVDGELDVIVEDSTADPEVKPASAEAEPTPAS